MNAVDASVAAAGRPPLSFFRVERDARWRIWALFGLLVLVVCVCLVPLSLLLALLPHLRQRGSAFSTAYWAYPGFGPLSLLRIALQAAGLTVAFGLLIAAAVWLVARTRARARLVKVLHAAAPDAADTYHRRLVNVVDELRVAAGLPQLDTVVIPSLTVNAVSFAGPLGPACVGITEGALSRLSRPQLQAVVAHEVAHVASHDCAVATRACLLFLGVRRLAGAYGRGLAVGVLLGYVAICLAGLMPVAPLQIGVFWGITVLLVWTAMWLAFWIAVAGGSVVDVALSRQREWAADAAAVHFTSDPASLAEALQMIEWQQGCVPGIPRALAALSISPLGPVRTSGWRGWFETHPPLAARIERLQALAAQRGQSLWQRRAAVARRIEAREHAVPAHAGRGRTDRPVAGAAADAVALCPRCGGALHVMVYEGSTIMECMQCGGVGATSPQVEAILARRDWGFTPDQERMATMIERSRPSTCLPWAVETAQAGICPLCTEPMRRAPWSLAYPLPADSCDGCDLHWFDHDEIEVLQILVERQNK